MSDLALSIAEQKKYMRLVREITAERAVPPLAYVDTYGCQQNESDSEKLRGMLSVMGYGFTDDEFQADIIIINTCAVRENAENRVYGNVGALVHTKKENRSQIIVFCGCMAAISGTAEKIRRSYTHVSVYFPPNALWRFPEFLYRKMTDGSRVFITEPADGHIVEDIPVLRGKKVSAWLPVMYGCDNFCTYCIVPYTRGRERSREPGAVISEARALAAEGYKDITLLGQNVNSYNGGSTETPDFPTLIRRINDIDGEFLIRFMTSHPKDASKTLFEAMAACEKAARHIHLPFQAGNDRVLKLMNRGYTSSDFLRKIKMARETVPDIVITSDVIVGFPGETEEDFEDTLRLIETAKFDALFTFIYSKRPGTPAAKLCGAASPEELQRRFDRLTLLQNAISEESHAKLFEKTVRVLITEETGSGSYPVKARTNGGRLVHLPRKDAVPGSFVNVRITGGSSWSMFAEWE